MIIGVTGGEGRLGRALVERGCVPVNCDVTDRDSITTAVTEFSKLSEDSDSCIIHCAAVTEVDRCETDLSDQCYKVNHVGTANLRDLFSGRIIYISTDYIFSGLSGPYSEKSTPDPLGNYGDSKYLGETLMRTDLGDKIVRTTILYGSKYHPDFVTAILEKLYLGKPFYVTTALQGNPTNVHHLAEALVYLCNMNCLNNLPDTINIAGRDVLSRYEFALMIAGVFEMDKKLIMPTNSVPGRTFRPKKAGLKLRLAEKFGIPLYSAVEGLKDMLKRFTEG